MKKFLRIILATSLILGAGVYTLKSTDVVKKADTVEVKYENAAKLDPGGGRPGG